MFDFVANHKRILQVILGLTILPFAFFGLDQYTRSGGGGNAAATVDGSPMPLAPIGLVGEGVCWNSDRMFGTCSARGTA